MIANCITVSRLLFSLAMLALSPCSAIFAVFYLLCGMSDMLDGFLARKLHTESKAGERLDSIADLFFAAVYALKILPILDIPLWIWMWTGIVAAAKITGILLASNKEHKLSIEHSFWNKLTGFMLFLFPLLVYVSAVKYGATLVCIMATITVIKETANRKGH